MPRDISNELMTLYIFIKIAHIKPTEMNWACDEHQSVKLYHVTSYLTIIWFNQQSYKLIQWNIQLQKNCNKYRSFLWTWWFSSRSVTKYFEIVIKLGIVVFQLLIKPFLTIFNTSGYNSSFSNIWTSYQIRKIVCCAWAGNAGNVFPKPKEIASYRSWHASRHELHARALVHVGIANPRWRGKHSRHSRHMRNTRCYVSGRRSMETIQNRSLLFLYVYQYKQFTGY